MLRIAICDDTEHHSEQLMKHFRAFAAELSVSVEIECFASLVQLGKVMMLIWSDCLCYIRGSLMVARL